MSAKDVEKIADIVNGTKYDGHGTAAEEYYRTKLLKLKLEKVGADTLSAADKQKIQNATSEREGIELQILAKLSDITESSPEFAQVVDLTGTKDRYEQAKRLAEVTYDRIRSEQILRFYTPSKDAMAQHFKSRTLPSLQARAEGVARINDVSAGTAEGLAASLARLFGLPAPAGTARADA